MAQPKNKFKRYFNFKNPIILGVYTGLYPLLFYVSNNFYAVNSWSHFVYFTGFFIGIPVLLFSFIYYLSQNISFIRRYYLQILFACILLCLVFFLSFAATLLIKKKLLAIAFIGSILLATKLGHTYKKIIILLLLLTVLPFLKLSIKIIDLYRADIVLNSSASLTPITFKNKPNVYLIQPDGYASKAVMEDTVYNYKNNFFNWLESQKFTLYPDFRSNYPASLPSNASMFLMRQHKFFNMTFPDLEMPRAREIISGKNPVITTFKNNGYKTYMIVQDDYFQQNKCNQGYDYTNIAINDISFFSNGSQNKANVYTDLEEFLEIPENHPKFFFIEKLLPHHVHFSGSKKGRVARERKEYLSKIETVNSWLQKTITLITKKDPQAIIIVLADHGGWVGLESYSQMFQTKNKTLLKSVFGNLAAIKWNGHLKNNEDKNLTSNVNVFTVLFSVLSEDNTHLKAKEDDASYNLRIDGYFSKKVHPVFDADGQLIY